MDIKCIKYIHIYTYIYIYIYIYICIYDLQILLYLHLVNRSNKEFQTVFQEHT